MKKGFLLFTFTFVLCLTGCSSALSKAWINGDSEKEVSSTILEETTAISKVVKLQPGFPSKPGKMEGGIYGGGPAPGIKVAGVLETQIKKRDKGTYVVTLTESWDRNVFLGSSSQAADRRISSHFWKYKVTMDTVELIEEGGDFPPQNVR